MSEHTPAERLRVRAEELNKILSGAPAEYIVGYVLDAFKGRIALSSSLSIEDQTLTDMAVRHDSAVRVFTLDTGRLFPETYDLIDRTNMKYHIRLEVFFPDYKEVERMVREKGVNLFYDSLENRHLCCRVRKLEPLKRAFRGTDVWICGLRRSQSVTRRDIKTVEYDDIHCKIKVNPLIAWTEEEVWRYVRARGVPYNTLHDHGYPSIGCQPCTRQVKKGEDVRSGRWWWESPDHRECGLHKR